MMYNCTCTCLNGGKMNVTKIVVWRGGGGGGVGGVLLPAVHPDLHIMALQLINVSLFIIYDL